MPMSPKQYHDEVTRLVSAISSGGGGGGGGSTVAWEQLTTDGEHIANVIINGEITNVFAPIGGGGSSYSITNIWNYVTDNNGVVNYDVATRTLRDDIENYDFLILELISSVGDSVQGGSWRGTNQVFISVEVLRNAYEPYYMNYTSYATRSSRWHIEGTTCACVTSAGGSINGLVNVYGIKL